MRGLTNGRALLYGAAMVFATPLFVFLVVATTSGMPVDAIADALVEQLTTDRLNLLVMGGLGLVPIVLLTGALAIYKKVSKRSPSLAMVWGGVFTSLVVLLWANATYWPTYLPSLTYPGFPHGLELVLGPLFFAPPAMVLGVVVGWIVQRPLDAP